MTTDSPLALRRVGRTVTLVASHRGDVLGALPPFDVETPFWQDVEPIGCRLDGIAVLRLLDVTPSPGMSLGGHATYLVEWLAPGGSLPTSRVALEPWSGSVDDDPLRMPWARPGGPTSDLGWARAQLGADGAVTQHRTWNLSAIWSLRAGSDTAWLKCVPPFFAHEGAVLKLLAPGPVPELVAAEGHRLLLADLPGHDGYTATFEERADLIDRLVELQMSTVERTGEFLARGVPDRRWSTFVRSAERVIERRAGSSAPLGHLVSTVDDRIGAIEDCGLPDVLVHGDAHPGNARIGEGASRGIWFDWGDSTIGHPLLDLAVLDRPGTPYCDELVRHWLDAWKRAVPRSDPHRAWPLVRPLAALVGAVVYQNFLDCIERSERVYHDGDVDPCLERAARLVV